MTGADVPDHVELTTREREVLAMLVEGKTNREIGAALFISESTAGVHVSNILAKLGVGSRTEAAALAARAGLAGTPPPPLDEPAADVPQAAADAPPPPLPTGWRARVQAQMRRHPTSTAIGVGGVVILAALTTGLAFAVLTADRPTGAVDPSSTPIGLASDEATTPTPTALDSGSPTPSPTAAATSSPSPPATSTSASTNAPVAAPTPTPNVTWIQAGTGFEGRSSHTATVLADGSVLIIGGVKLSEASCSATVERYDPATDQWTVEPPMSTRRCEHTATLLNDGRVIVAGGRPTDTMYSQNGVEIFDPHNGSWTTAYQMSSPRAGHTATRMTDGRVLIFGGRRTDVVDRAPAPWADLYDPTVGGSEWEGWSQTTAPAVGREMHTATLLADGTLLVAGGHRGCCGVLASAERYDPETETWSSAGSMAQGREMAAATLLTDGRVLVVGGGSGGDMTGLDSAEIFDPSSGQWTSTEPMAVGRWFPTLTVLEDGRVLAVGGAVDGNSTEAATAEVFDPATGTWTVDGHLHLPRVFHTATLLDDGTVLVVGTTYSEDVAAALRYIPLHMR